jgi:acyl-ACP thioesterase
MIWIHLGPDLQPQRLGERFLTIYEASAEGRRASTRLKLPGPPAEAAAVPWTLRSTDIDQLGHVNNAAYWIAVEEHFELTSPHRAVLEYRQPLDLGDPVELQQANEAPVRRRRSARCRGSAQPAQSVTCVSAHQDVAG